MACPIRSSSLAPPTPAPRLRVSQLPTKLKISRWKQGNTKKRVWVVRASVPEPGSDERDSGNGFPGTPSKVFVEEAIGAEYGEGFETFRMDGPLKVDVADTSSLKLAAWEQLAMEEGKEIPDDGYIQRSMLHMAADHVLHKVLCWEDGASNLKRLKSRLLQLYYENLLKLSTPVEGLKEWLDALYTAGTPCAVVSCLDRRNMLEALERMELRRYFQAIVSEEDGMESMAHRFLSAALKLDRKPSKCIVFEDDPRGITAAHNCTMMAVALIGTHPAYELVQADLAVGSFSELSVINLRRLFAHKGFNFMDLQRQIIEKTPPKRKLTTDTIF